MKYSWKGHKTQIKKKKKKKEQAELVENLLQVTYPMDICIICIHFYYGEKVKLFDFLKTNDNNKTFAHR